MVISYLSDSNYDIDHIEHKGDIYIFYITDDNGEDIGTITVDSITKRTLTTLVCQLNKKEKFR